jgi:hypothetical protein
MTRVPSPPYLLKSNDERPGDEQGAQRWLIIASNKKDCLCRKSQGSLRWPVRIVSPGRGSINPPARTTAVPADNPKSEPIQGILPATGPQVIALHCPPRVSLN